MPKSLPPVLPLDPRVNKRAPIASYPRFVLYALARATEGGWRFYAVVALLLAVALSGANAWAHQLVQGMAVTGMTDHVSWGLYIANFTFAVGLAAAAVLMVIPAYLYRNEDMHDVVLIGELVAVASIVVCLLFVTVDLGRPDRFWHLVPGLGRFNWPISLLAWDVIVLNGYLLLNLHVCGYLIYMRFLGLKPAKRWYLPFVFLSIGWAISIHTVTAFLYSGLGGRPFWNSALLAPRFLASAFVSGPAFIILLLRALRRWGRIPVPESSPHFLARVLRVTVLVNLFMFASEAYTALYTGGAHGAPMRYLLLGLHGRHGLVGWIWAALALNVASAVLLLSRPARAGRVGYVNLACACAFAGVWIEKGMGLVIPGFVPSTLHELVEYQPTLAEWRVTLGIWAAGALVLLAGIKIAHPVLSGRLKARAEWAETGQRPRAMSYYP